MLQLSAQRQGIHAVQWRKATIPIHTREPYPKPGVGLAMGKKIIERHSGRIWYESELGQGTTFFFTLPY